MESKNTHEFSSDRPILRVEDDLLGRANFSANLANAISSWHGNDSLVVALHGNWGSGKSSIKNMAIANLKSKENNPDIIEFTPWEWAAQDKITASFFQEVSSSIGRKDKSKSGKKLAATLKKYGRYLNTGELIATGLSAALPTLFIFATVVGIGSSFFDEGWIKNTSIVLLAVFALCASVLKWGKKFLNSLSGNIEITEQSLNEIREELTDLLSKRTTSIIVVMDDLDRLTTEQLQMVFQLVKANVEFPNVVFLLLFQRDLVEEKLSDGKQSGRDFLEKIIQVPFDIPKIETTQVHNLLFNKIDAILKQDKSATKMFDSNYWNDIFHSGLNAYFDNLRNVYRFISTLSFNFSLLKGKTAFEVNPVDLIAIECLRIFEPDIYKEIARAKEIFTTNKSESDKTTEDLISMIIEKASEGKKSAAEGLIKRLFPTLDETKYSSDSLSSSWLRNMRICHPSNFDKYFQFSIPSGEISNSDLQEMLSLTSESKKLSSFILSLQERGILRNALSQFESYTDDVLIENGKSYIKGLLDIGDKVDHESIDFITLSPHDHVEWLVVQFLRRYNNVEERSKLLLECFKKSDGISIVEHILMCDEDHREKMDGDMVLSDNEFTTLKQEFIRKLVQMSDQDPNNLMNHEHLESFLYHWRLWGDQRKAISWVQAQTKNTEGCIKLLKAFVNKSHSHLIGSHVVKLTNYIKLENIEKFIDIELELIIQKVSSVNIKELGIKEREAVEAFNKAIEDRKNGITSRL